MAAATRPGCRPKRWPRRCASPNPTCGCSPRRPPRARRSARSAWRWPPPPTWRRRATGSGSRPTPCGSCGRARSALPFLAALAIIVLVVAGIGLMTLARRGEDSQREAVVRAALGQNDALQRLDYAAFRANTCAQQAGRETEVLDRQRSSVAQRGARYVDNV